MGKESMVEQGKKVLMLCAGYFYAGVVEETTEFHVVLSSARVVYDTGDPEKHKWDTVRELRGDGRVMVMWQAVEAVQSADGLF